MNPTDQDPMEDRASSDPSSIAELRDQLNTVLQELSPERLKILADFAAFLTSAAGEAATQELLAIPSLWEQVRENQSTPTPLYTPWRKLRSDV
ncbi:hypothetical protein [Acaryochloris thomasi]|uniref:hypothetical protein n=1 Tax=Acaryochloris thomasi TaxID=2929456 RepID=UPI000DA69551|nr:hypothetical protein [Acaryochloris thomasi]